MWLIDMDRVSFTITSCNRIDLLEKTLNSFFSINNFDIDEFIISDDSGSNIIFETLNKRYGEKFKIIHNKKQIGLSKSLDNLFNEVRNNFIFHCEDDWFFEKNPNFILDSLNILKEFPNIHQVYVRHQNNNPHHSNPEIFETKTGVKFKMVSQNFTSLPNQTWNGFSWNPGLRRKSDYIKMFPNGFSQFGDEYLCCDHTKKFNYQSAVLINTSCYHIGNYRTNGFMN
jgi:GT2 family glycosyltransferase